jgi:hypothetical protein
MRIRYRPDRTEHQAWLSRRRATPDAEGPALFVRYGTAIAVSRLEAQRDCELLAATGQELAELPAAGYHIPLAGDFRGADGLPAQAGRRARPCPLSGVRG